MAGWPMLAGALIAAAVLTKPQGLFVIPSVAIAIWNAGDVRSAPSRVARATAGALMTTAAVISPFIAAGTWRNMLFIRGLIATQDPDMSEHAYNLWWVAGNLMRAGDALVHGAGVDAIFTANARVVAYTTASAYGFPHLKAVRDAEATRAVRRRPFRDARGRIRSAPAIASRWSI